MPRRWSPIANAQCDPPLRTLLQTTPVLLVPTVLISRFPTFSAPSRRCCVMSCAPL